MSQMSSRRSVSVPGTLFLILLSLICAGFAAVAVVGILNHSALAPAANVVGVCTFLIVFSTVSSLVFPPAITNKTSGIGPKNPYAHFKDDELF